MEETGSDLWPAGLHTGLGFGGLHHRYGPLEVCYDKEVLLFTRFSCRWINFVVLNVGKNVLKVFNLTLSKST